MESKQRLDERFILKFFGPTHKSHKQGTSRRDYSKLGFPCNNTYPLHLALWVLLWGNEQRLPMRRAGPRVYHHTGTLCTLGGKIGQDCDPLLNLYALIVDDIENDQSHVVADKGEGGWAIEEDKKKKKNKKHDSIHRGSSYMICRATRSRQLVA